MIADMSNLLPGYSTRSASFENESGAPGAGGTVAGGRKGRPCSVVPAGETMVLTELEGPGTVRHFWIAFRLAPPEEMRSLHLEVFYDDSTEPSISVPLLDYFGLPHGRFTEYYSEYSSCAEGRGMSSYLPIPFRSKVRFELQNRSPHPFAIYHQITWTQDPERSGGLLHAVFRRENPTTLGQDFAILEGLRGRGRFAGCNVGVRILEDRTHWYGEGEVKMFIDDDDEYPTICGTGLEDYVSSAWGLGRHSAPYMGSPLHVGPPVVDGEEKTEDLVSFYRWHALDPVVFERGLRVTIQQIGAAFFSAERSDEFHALRTSRMPTGWLPLGEFPELSEISGGGLFERVDDYCATAFVYLEDIQGVPRPDHHTVTADIERLPFEKATTNEDLHRKIDAVLADRLVR